MNKFILTVKDLFSNIKINLESNYPFIAVKGMVTSTNFDTKGNLYFTLSDSIEEKCSINCICWQTKLDKLSVNPTTNNINQHEIIVKGYIQLYQTSTRVSLIVIDLLHKTESKLELLKKAKIDKLKNENYFDEKHKKPIPLWCNIVGVITAKESNAQHDIINSIKNRFPTKILLYSTYTQGNYAVNGIIEAIEYFNSFIESHKKPKVLIITRGGGSKEDLDIFNEEALVISIFNSKIPIVTAIGHSKDISLSDLVADSYAITPTAAAEKIFKITFQEFKNTVNQSFKHLNKIYLDKISLLKIKKQIVSSKILGLKLILHNKVIQINELYKRSKFTIQERYKFKLFQTAENYSSLNNAIKNEISKYKNTLSYTIKSLFNISNIPLKLSYNFYYYHKLLIQATKTNTINKQKDYKQTLTKFLTLKSSITHQKLQLKYFTNTLNSQILLCLKQLFTKLDNLNNILELNSHTNILKRGYTIIKDPSTEKIIKNSKELLNKDTFEIVFYDKSIKINKNN